MAEQLVQLALALLLGLNAVWCVLLHQRLRQLRNEGNSLRTFAAEIDAVVERAAQTLRALKTDCAAIESRLRRHTDNARRRGDELKRVCDLAAALAARLQDTPARPQPTGRGPLRPVAGSAGDGRVPRGGERQAAVSVADGADAGSADGDGEDRAELLRLLSHLR